jgi:hypothetical protein
MNIVNLIGKVTDTHPVINNTKMFTLNTDNCSHVLSARGKYKAIAESLQIGQRIAVQGSLTNHNLKGHTVTIISIEDLLIL